MRYLISQAWKRDRKNGDYLQFSHPYHQGGHA